MTNTTINEEDLEHTGMIHEGAIAALRNTINEQAEVIYSLEMLRNEIAAHVEGLNNSLDSLTLALNKEDMADKANTFLDRWTGDT